MKYLLYEKCFFSNKTQLSIIFFTGGQNHMNAFDNTFFSKSATSFTTPCPSTSGFHNDGKASMALEGFFTSFEFLYMVHVFILT